MPWYAVALLALVVVVTAGSLIGISRRQKRNHAIADWVRGQPMTYSTRAFVRQHFPLRWTNWSYKYGGGPMVSVRTRGIEVTAAQGMILESRTVFFDAAKTRMWIDHVGWGGTALNRRRCIRLCSGNGGNGVDLAVSPDAGIEPTWQAFLEAGVTAEARAQPGVDSVRTIP